MKIIDKISAEETPQQLQCRSKQSPRDPSWEPPDCLLSDPELHGLHPVDAAQAHDPFKKAIMW